MTRPPHGRFDGLDVLAGLVIWLVALAAAVIVHALA